MFQSKYIKICFVAHNSYTHFAGWSKVTARPPKERWVTTSELYNHSTTGLWGPTLILPMLWYRIMLSIHLNNFIQWLFTQDRGCVSMKPDMSYKANTWSTTWLYSPRRRKEKETSGKAYSQSINLLFLYIYSLSLYSLSFPESTITDKHFI